MNRKANFFYKTNLFESVHITNRIESIRIANWNALVNRPEFATACMWHERLKVLVGSEVLCIPVLCATLDVTVSHVVE